MLRTAEAKSHAAITIVNAMAARKGAALGIKLWTKATVTVTDHPGEFVARNISDPRENADLARVTAQYVFAKFHADKRFGAFIQTESNIPIAVGLKSSSAASNSVALASLYALGRKRSDVEVVKLGVEASLRARVTITGAYDDACASYFGGLVVTDNAKRRILKRCRPERELRFLVLVPRMKRYTRSVNPKPMKAIKPLALAVHREVLRGNYWRAMTLNGLIYSMALGYDTTTTWAALNAGALAAGLTGKGPAVAAVVSAPDVRGVQSAWRDSGGKIIETSFNFHKATVSRSQGWM